MSGWGLPFRNVCASFIQQQSISLDVETFTEARPLVPNPGYGSDRLEALEGLRAELAKGSIDGPMIDVVERFTRLPCCYTLQSCYGHFMIENRTEDRNTNPVAYFGGTAAVLHYRIAYMAFCIEDSAGGRALLGELKAIAVLDPEYIQFGSADWFWGRCVNSYVLQVSPLKNAHEDHFDVSMEDAMRIEQTRDRFIERMREILLRNQDSNRSRSALGH